MKFLDSWEKYKIIKEATEGSGTGKVSYMYGMTLVMNKKATEEQLKSDAINSIPKDFHMKNGTPLLIKTEKPIDIKIERFSNNKPNWNISVKNSVNGFWWEGHENNQGGGSKVVFNDIDTSNAKFTFKVTAPTNIESAKFGNLPLVGIYYFDTKYTDNPNQPINTLLSKMVGGAGTQKPSALSFAKNGVIQFEAVSPIIYLIYGDILPPEEKPATPAFDGFEFDSPVLSENGKAEIKKIIEANKNATTPVKKYTIKTGASKDGEDEQLSTGKNAIRDKAFPNGTTRLNWDFWLVIKRYENIEAYLKELGITNIEKIGVPKDSNDTKNMYGKFDNADLKSTKNRYLEIKPVQ